MDYKEIIVKENRVYNGMIINLNVDTVILPNGREAKREVVHHPGGVGVVAVDNEGYVYLVEQFRVPYNTMMLEIPAGKLDKGNEDIESAARRELSEETGLEAENIQFIGEFYPSVGYTDENLRLFVATGLTFKNSHPDEDEFVNLKKYHFDDAVKMVMDGTVKDGKTIAAILMAKNLLNL